MKTLFAVLALLLCTSLPLNALAVVGFGGEKFVKVVYFEKGGKGKKTGIDAGNARDIVDASIMAIPADSVVTNVYVVIDTAITGSTAIDIGDDDSANGFVPTASLTLATPGMYGWDAKAKGSYLRVQTAGATDAGDIYVVPQAKYYSAGTKSVKLDNTTANTAGKFRVVIEGYRL